MSDFRADLTAIENGINKDVQPAVEHFRGQLEAVDVITEYSSSLSNGTPTQDAVVSLYTAASTAVLDRQRGVVRSLEEFREALKDIVRTYRTVDESNADGFRGQA